MKNVIACFLSLLPLVASDATGTSLRHGNKVKKAKPVDVMVLTEALWYVRIEIWFVVYYNVLS